MKWEYNKHSYEQFKTCDSNDLLSMKPSLILSNQLISFFILVLPYYQVRAWILFFFFILGVGASFSYTYFSSFCGTYPGRDYDPCKDAHFYCTNSFTTIFKLLFYSSHLITKSLTTSHQFTYIKQFTIHSCISNWVSTISNFRKYISLRYELLTL